MAADMETSSLEGIKAVALFADFGNHIDRDLIFHKNLGNAFVFLLPGIQDKIPYPFIKTGTEHVRVDSKYFFQFITIVDGVQGEIAVIHVHCVAGTR